MPAWEYEIYHIGDTRSTEETERIAALGRDGVRADPGMTMFWYRRARDLGAADAGSRLIGLEAKHGAWW